MNAQTIERITQKAVIADEAVGGARASLANLVTKEEMFNLSDLARLTNNVASAIGANDAWAHALLIVKYYDGTTIAKDFSLIGPAILDSLTSKLLQGADDSWSGRGNDVARSQFDGFRNAARGITDLLGS